MVRPTRSGKTTAAAKTESRAVEKPAAARVNGRNKAETVKAPTKRKIAAVEPKDEDESEAEADDIREDDEEEDEEDEEEAKPKKPAAKKRKTTKAAAAKKSDDMVLAPRTTVGSLKRALYIGAHVSAAGGVHNSIQNATQIGANAFALFLKSQRKWANPPLAAEARDQFRALAAAQGFDPARHVLPHGSYLVNLAQADAAKAAQAYDNFVDDLRRCDALGVRLYNFHPGSAGAGSSGDAAKKAKADAIARIAAQLNRAHAAKGTGAVVTVIENMCGSGNVVGSRFEELRDIIALVRDKSRVGVCIDTCHAFAAGYDLRSPKVFAATMKEFDDVVGMEYLKALHINDSKAPFGSHRDVHANIGTGFLGLRAFHSVVNYAPFEGMPLVLETPIDEKGADGKAVENRQVWADEIKLLESLVGMDAESAAFAAKAAELQARGAAERNRHQEQADKKAGKDAKAAAKAAKATTATAAASKKGAGAGKRAGRTVAQKKKVADDSEESGCDSC